MITITNDNNISTVAINVLHYKPFYNPETKIHTASKQAVKAADLKLYTHRSVSLNSVR